MPKLTAKQELFVKEYIVDFNATRAAKDAGYSEKTAHSIGHENLSKPEIQKAIQTAINKTHEKLEITTERIAEELADMAFKKVNASGLLTGGFKYSDKTKALELLGKHKVMFTDKVETELTGNLTATITVKGHKA